MISLLFKNSIIYSHSHVLYFEALKGFCYDSANAYLLSCVRFFVTPQTVACQAPLSIGILLARILEWVAMPSARGWSPHQGSHPGLPQCRWILYHLSHQQSPECWAYPFPRVSSWPMKQTGVSSVAGRFIGNINLYLKVWLKQLINICKFHENKSHCILYICLYIYIYMCIYIWR